MESSSQGEYKSQEGPKIQSLQSKVLRQQAKLADHEVVLGDLKKAVARAEEAAKNTEATFADFKEKYKETKDELKENKSLVIVGFIVLLVMVAGLLLDAFRSKSDSSPVTVNNYAAPANDSGTRTECVKWAF